MVGMRGSQIVATPVATPCPELQQSGEWPVLGERLRGIIEAVSSSASIERAGKCLGRESIDTDKKKKRDIANLRWWSLGPGIDPQVSRALSTARGGLRRLDHGCGILKDLEFPNQEDVACTLDAISLALETLRNGLQSLEDMVQEAVNWQKRCPGGGRLLQKQMCIAAKGVRTPLEWSAGRLCISTENLLFESNDSPSWCVGPIRWEEIEQFEQCEDGDLRLYISGENEVLMLSGISRVHWLQQLGGLVSSARARAETGSDSFCTAVMSFSDLDLPYERAVSGENLEAWLDLYSPKTCSGRAVNVAQDARQVLSLPGDEEAHDTTSTDVTDAEGEVSSISGMNEMNGLLTNSFYELADQVPPAEAPQRQEPVFTQVMPEVSLELVRRALHATENWPSQIHLEQEMQATISKATPWVVSSKVEGTHMRRLQFRMPVPADVPQAVKKLAKVPNETACTLLSRIGSSDGLVVLVQEVVCHDITFGDSFSVVEVLSFRAHSEGGILFEKYVDVRWILALPWYAGAIRTFLEMKAKIDGKASASFWARYLRDKCSASPE